MNRESLSGWHQDAKSDLLQVQPQIDPTSKSTEKGKAKKRAALEKRRKVIFYFALALVFIRFSMIHQILAYQLHTELYLLYWVSIPVFIGVIVLSGLKRVFQYQPAIYWTAFGLWLIPTSFFSTWKGGSTSQISGYYRTELIMLFAIAFLVITWKECRLLLYTIAAAALINVASVIFYSELDQNGRTSLVFGTVANPNDYAGHLIYVLPFLLWLILTSKSIYLRIAVLLAMALGLYEILAAGSRGAMLGLVAALVVFAITTTPKLRRILLLTTPILAVLIIALLPGPVVHRIFLFSANSSETSSEAIESSNNREQLLKDSIKITLQNPLFGVGPGQFGNNEGQQTASSGQALWYEAHNSFTQIASENGIPGFVLYVGGILSTLLLLNRTGRYCIGRSTLKEIASAVLCLRISLISFCITIFFLNFGYFFYLPAMAGIAIALATSTKKLMTGQNIRQKERKPDPTTNLPLEAADWNA